MKMTYDIKFIEKADTVIAFATPNRLDERLEKLRRLVAFYFDVKGEEIGQLLMTDSSRIPNPTIRTYKGVAKLKAGDKQDIELAKSIARKKAIRQATAAYREAFKTLNRQLGIIKYETEATIDSLVRKGETFTSEIKGK